MVGRRGQLALALCHSARRPMVGQIRRAGAWLSYAWPSGLGVLYGAGWALPPNLSPGYGSMCTPYLQSSVGDAAQDEEMLYQPEGLRKRHRLTEESAGPPSARLRGEDAEGASPLTARLWGQEGDRAGPAVVRPRGLAAGEAVPPSAWVRQGRGDQAGPAAERLWDGEAGLAGPFARLRAYCRAGPAGPTPRGFEEEALRPRWPDTPVEGGTVYQPSDFTLGAQLGAPGRRVDPQGRREQLGERASPPRAQTWSPAGRQPGRAIPQTSDWEITLGGGNAPRGRMQQRAGPPAAQGLSLIHI